MLICVFNNNAAGFHRIISLIFMMRNEWLVFMELNEGDPFVMPSDPLVYNTFSFLSKPLFLPTFHHPFSNLSSSFFLCFSTPSSPRPLHLNFSLFQPHSLASLFSSSFKHLFTLPPNFRNWPILSLASALTPPPFNLSSDLLALSPQDAHFHMLPSLDHLPCDVRLRGSDRVAIRPAVEPITGIEFPGALNNILTEDNQSPMSSEVLVGTGSRTTTIVKIKSLKIYAFGFYVHPYSVCQKLGSKYTSVLPAELKEHNDFYEDLLREDIGMTVRLVVNCNGMKINTVKDAFEKSLRARLVKTNPETDFKCISTFSSYFTKDIPLPMGTIIDFRRTADGRLITEIGGNQVGVVSSKELCRAFFDMYLGEVPISKQTKEEIGRNVVSIMRGC